MAKTNKTNKTNLNGVRIVISEDERQEFEAQISQYLQVAVNAVAKGNKKEVYAFLENALHLARQINLDIQERIQEVWVYAVSGMVQFQTSKAYYELVAQGNLDLNKMIIARPNGVSLYYCIYLGRVDVAKGRKMACEKFIASSKRLEQKIWFRRNIFELMQEVRKSEAKEKALVNAKIDELLNQAEEVAGLFASFIEEIKPLLDEAKELAQTIGEDISYEIQEILLFCLCGSSRESVLAVA